MKRIAIAIVGAGHLGRIHVGLLARRPDARITAVVDPDPEARRRVQDEFGIEAHAEPDGIPPDTQAVVLAAPTRCHAELGQTLLERGFHLFIEKPMTDRHADAVALAEQARQANRLIQVGHVERFNPAWLAARPLLEDVTRVSACRHSGFPARCLDAGVVLDLMIHDIDLVLDLFGERPSRVQAWGQVVVGPHEDAAVAWLEFPSGRCAYLDASRVAPGKRRELELVGPSGTVRCDLVAGNVHHIPIAAPLRAVAPYVAQWPLARRKTFADELHRRWMPLRSVPLCTHNAIQREHDTFLEAIRTGGTPPVTAEAGRDAVAVAEDILESIARREAVVREGVARPPASAA